MSERHVVKVGELRVAHAGAILVTLGLGSCVAIALYDPERRIGGLGHVLLPEPTGSRHSEQPGRFASTAVAPLLELMEAEGASRERIYARLAGGAAMFPGLVPNGFRNLGMRNVEAARAALSRAGVPVVAEDVGGAHGRSMHFRIEDGQIRVTSLNAEDVIL